MAQITDIFITIVEEIFNLSLPTLIFVLLLSINSSVLSLQKAYQNLKELKNIIKERKEDKKRWDQVLKKAEQELEYVSTIINQN